MRGNGVKVDILITNNPLVAAEYKGTSEVEYIDTDMIGLLTYVRDLVHKGHKLLTHPLTGSVKPNETPYKSILITKTASNPDVKSVSIIEESILTAQKFPPKEINEKYLKDMQMVDLSLINFVK